MKSLYAQIFCCQNIRKYSDKKLSFAQQFDGHNKMCWYKVKHVISFIFYLLYCYIFFFSYSFLLRSKGEKKT